MQEKHEPCHLTSAEKYTSGPDKQETDLNVQLSGAVNPAKDDQIIHRW